MCVGLSVCVKDKDATMWQTLSEKRRMRTTVKSPTQKKMFFKMSRASDNSMLIVIYLLVSYHRKNSVNRNGKITRGIY